MSIPHLWAILPLEVEDIPHLFTIYQLSNSHIVPMPPGKPVFSTGIT
jgi:hypothetical protein